MTSPASLATSPTWGGRVRRYYPTARDREIVTAVFTHRALTSDQVALLLWGQPKASTRCRLRLRFLSENGYRERSEQPVTLSEVRRPLVYFLAPEGLTLAVAQMGLDPADIDWKPSYNNVKWLFVDHLLATNDIRVRLEYSAPRAGLTITTWHDDKTLSRQLIHDRVFVEHPKDGRQTVSVGPDGYFAITAPDGVTQHRVFIEADRGTVPLSRWKEKVTAYLAYFRSRAFVDRYHANKPFRVLTVTTSPQRLAHMKAVTEEAAGRSWFWSSTYEAIADPDRLLFVPVWYMAGQGDTVCFPYPLLG